MLGQIVADPTGTSPAAALITAAMATTTGLAFSVVGYYSSSFQVTGITTAFVRFDGSIDGGSTWFTLLGTGPGGNNTTGNSSDGMWAPLQQWALTHIRPTISSYTSGTITVTAIGRVR